MSLVIGLACLILPFCLVFAFTDWHRGFIAVFCGVLGFSILIPLVTQSLGVFTYGVVLTLYIMGILVTGGVFLELYRRKKIHLPRRLLYRNTFILIFSVVAAAIVFFELYSVHYHYTGPVATINGQETVTNSNYPYPIYSDEWITAALAQFSITHHTLPLINPLADNERQMDFVLPFHALAADIFLLLGLSPVNGFAVVTILAGLITCLLVYIVSRCFKLSRPASLATALLVPLITNSGNLPSAWYFLTYTTGLWALLATIGAAALDDIPLTYCAAFLSLILYPPFVVFILPVLLVATAKKSWKKVTLGLGTIIMSGVVIVALLALAGFSVQSLFTAIGNDLVHLSSDGGLISFYPWNIIPIAALIFSLVGIYAFIRQRQSLFFVLIFVGMIFWAAYSWTPWVFIIEYFRLVVVMAVLLCIAAGAGLDFLMDIFRQSRREDMVAAVVVCVFIIGAFFYPNQSKWQKLTLTVVGDGGIAQVLIPAAPINRYLTADDLHLFHNLKNKYFIAPPWKGLVIGVATNNFPLESKGAYIADNTLSYDTFSSASCSEKMALAKKYHMTYVYSATFSCADFTTVGTSTENLVLYHFITAASPNPNTRN